MKKTVLSLMASFLIIAFVVPAQAVTIWEPTESGIIDINYLALDEINSIAMFDDSDMILEIPLMLVAPSDTIFFTQNGDDWDLVSTVSGNTLTLADSPKFMLGMQPVGTSGWMGNTGEAMIAAGMYNVNWVDPEVTITIVDAQPVVPVPATILLLVPGLLGIIGLRRFNRK